MGLLLDGVLSASLIDSSGEIVDIEGADISDFNNGRAYVNWEHSSKSAEDIVGICKMAVKIFKESDCKTERQKMFWKAVKEKPYIYLIAELFDSEDHPGAIACAAMVNHFKKNNQKIQIGWSTEGATLERQGNKLVQTVMRRVAFTLRPCLRAAEMGVISEKEVEQALSKNSIEINSLDIGIDENLLKTSPYENIMLHLEDLNKTLTAGMGNVAPSALVGGAALSKEYIAGKKNIIKAAIRDWNRKRPLKEIIKAALPEVSEEYLDTFTDLAEDLALKKGLPKVELKRVGKEHGHFMHDDDQHQLIDGLYLDQSHEPAKEFEPRHKNFSNPIYDLQNDAGQRVLVKKPKKESGMFDFGDEAHNAAAYHRLAKDYFGLGKFVPATAIFSHPELKEGNYSAMEHIPNARTPLEMRNDDIEKALDKHFKSGDLHKLIVMDHILGHIDRHQGNLLINKQGNIHHIDNDLCLQPGELSPTDGFYYRDTAYTDHKLHPEAEKWLNSLDPAKMAEHMLKIGVEKDMIKPAIRRLKNYQNYAKKGYALKNIAELVHGASNVRENV